MKTLTIVTISLAGCLLSVPAHATLLGLTPMTFPGAAPGTNITTSGSAVSSPFCSSSTPKVNGVGTIVDDTCVVNRNVFSAGHPTGTSVSLREVVYQESMTNTLDFYYQIAIKGSSARSLADLFALPFSNVTVDVGTDSAVSLLGLSPHSTSGSNDSPSAIVGGNGAGSSPNSLCHIASNDCITWDFVPNLTTGGVTLTLVVSTDATQAIKDEIGADFGPNGVVDPIIGYAPLATPEPISIVLLGSVLAFSAFFIRRRSAARKQSSVS